MSIPRIRRCALALTTAFSLAMLLPSTVSAHAGEDHGEQAAATPSGRVLAPRVEAASEDVELLAVHERGTLTIYLSDFRTNAPLADLELEIESAGNTALAHPVSDGVYRADVPWLATPGRHPLVFTIQGEQVADLLEASLELPAPAADGHEDHLFDLTALGVAGSLGGIAAAGLLAFGLRRRKK